MKIDVALLVIATGITRFAFRSHYLYDIDSVNFALSLRHFDPSTHQPHPPGYFLYVCLGRLASLIFPDANTALVAISIGISCAAGAMIYVLADNWFGRSAAVFAGLIFLFSPLGWFHGTVALTYIVECFFSALAGYLCWRVFLGSAGFTLASALVLGVAAGFRPSSLLFLGPLWLFSLRNVGFRKAAMGLGTLAATLIAWIIPMVRMSGGKAYITALMSLWLLVPARGTVFNSSLVNSIARAGTIVGICFLFFGCAAILAIRPLKGRFGADRSQIIFTQVWIAPGLLFFTFIFLKFVNSGYLLILAPPACAWMGLWASTWYAGVPLSRASKMLVIAGCATLNTAIFICAPVYCSYGEVLRFETQLANIIGEVSQTTSARETMIVGFDSHFLGYRHAGYYLPGYLTVQFPEVQLIPGKRIFTMMNRNTRLERTLDTTGIRNFIIFPLPSGDAEYTSYMNRIITRFPAGELRIVAHSRTQYALAPVADLRFFFPDSMPLTARSFTASH